MFLMISDLVFCIDDSQIDTFLPKYSELTSHSGSFTSNTSLPSQCVLWAVFLSVLLTLPLKLIEQGLTAKGLFDKVMFEPTGPAGIFALYAPPGYPLGTVFLNEFLIDFVLGVVIFACVDPTNLLVPPAAVPWVVGFSYTMAISGFVPNGMAANTARDLGGRLMAITIWGTKATGGSGYAAIAALTNIPATILAALFYNFMLSDSHRGMFCCDLARVRLLMKHRSHQPCL
jgi:glycerol uptake facilitator-like aquaporin